jgi:type I restriction enzyme, S subunit
MSRIDELIAAFCPGGVSTYRLDQVFEIRGGYTPSKAEPKFWSDGTIPWFRMEDLRQNGRVLEFASQMVTANASKNGGTFDADSLIISTSATIGEHALVRVPFLANQRFSILTRREEFRSRLDPKFAFYIGFNLAQFCKENTSVSNFAGVVMSAFKAFKFPVPPLEVQREIVSILDKFTQLEAELEAELEARKIQYEVTRGRLLDFEGDLSQHPMGELGRATTGEVLESSTLGRVAQYPSQRLKANQLGSSNFVGVDNLLSDKQGKTESSHVPAQGSFTHFSTGAVLVGNIRPYLKKIWFADGPGGASGDVLCFEIKPEFQGKIIPRFLFHACASEKFFDFMMKSAKGAKMPRGDKQALLKYPISIPPLEIQREIVAILDKLDALVNDISSGLPAEIAARRKQYEYYRNKLLTFKELDAA